MKFTGIFKNKFSRDGVALEGEITTVTVAGPAEILVVSLGAQPDEIKEIANLVNAAPDLLAALQGLLNVGDSVMFQQRARENARAAIAKAKGA